MIGFILSKITRDPSLVPVTVSPALPNMSAKSMLIIIAPSVSLPAIVYVAVRSVGHPVTLALCPAIFTATPVSASLPVKEIVMRCPMFAYHVSLYDDVMFTNGSVGLTPKEVK